MTTDGADMDEGLRLDEAARWLGVSRRTLDREIREGRLQPQFVRSTPTLTRRQMIAYREAQTTETLARRRRTLPTSKPAPRSMADILAGLRPI